MHGDPLAIPSAPNQDILELERIKDQHQYDFAMKSLELTAQDNREARDLFAGNRKAGLIVTLALMLGVFSFFLSALFLNKEEIIVDLMKIIAGAFGGGGFGYAIGIRRGGQK
jgi:hypothetical protein